MQPEADQYATTVSGLISSMGWTAAVVSGAALVAVAVLLVRGVRARRRGGATVAAHWWLGAISRALVLFTAVAYALRLGGVLHDIALMSNQTGSTKGLADAFLVGAFRALPTLWGPLVVALAAAVAALLLGPPKEGESPGRRDAR